MIALVRRMYVGFRFFGVLSLIFITASSVYAATINLEFVVWNYAIPTIQDNIKQFEAENPNIKVNLAQVSH